MTQQATNNQDSISNGFTNPANVCSICGDQFADIEFDSDKRQCINCVRQQCCPKCGELLNTDRDECPQCKTCVLVPIIPSSASDTFTVLSCSITGIDFITVPSGIYTIGDMSDDETGNKKNTCQITIQPFLMAKYPVTQAQWLRVMRDNHSYFKGSNRPVDNVNWNEAQKFIAKLNNQSGNNYRLPSEAEWEYAARSGGKQEKWAGCNEEEQLKDYAWYDINSNGQTHHVGEKHANSLGLYDMSGNVMEWCQDSRHKDYNGIPTDGSAWEEDDSVIRILRGGSCGNDARGIQVSYRNYNNSDLRNINFGFRLVTILPLRWQYC